MTWFASSWAFFTSPVSNAAPSKVGFNPHRSICGCGRDGQEIRFFALKMRRGSLSAEMNRCAFSVSGRLPQRQYQSYDEKESKVF